MTVSDVISAEYRRLLDRFVDESRAILGGELVGVYLHGSAVMGCFNPRVSDLDLLTVVRGELPDGVRRQYLDMVVTLNDRAPAKGIEMSVVPASACRPFVYPTPFLLHFSAMHLDWYRRDPADYIVKMRGTDPDLAAHFTILYHRGICLYGRPIRDVFAEVDRASYFDSIRRDIENAETEILDDPIYITLNLCRVLAWAREGLILSKQEGGRWALVQLPTQYHGLIAGALRAYEDDGDFHPDPELSKAFAAALLREIKKEAVL